MTADREARELRSPVEIFGKDVKVNQPIRDFRPRPVKAEPLESLSGPTDAELERLQAELDAGQLTLGLEDQTTAAAGAAGAAAGAGNPPAPTPSKS